MFKNQSEFIKTIYEDYDNDYKDIVIKEEYELYPEISYPMITIEELSNTDASKYKDDNGEFASNLGYQINISSDQTATYTAQQNVRRIATIINTFLQKNVYKCLDRVGGLVIQPHVNDPNIKTGHLRYNCVVRHDNNTIYRRY